MSKEYAFTRTLVCNTITAMACDKVTAEVFNFSFDFPGTIPAEKTLKKIAQEHAPENAVVVDIADIQTSKKLLGMTFDFFVNNAVELDPKTRKPIH